MKAKHSTDSGKPCQCDTCKALAAVTRKREALQRQARRKAARKPLLKY